MMFELSQKKRGGAITFFFRRRGHRDEEQTAQRKNVMNPRICCLASNHSAFGSEKIITI
jgi:hypothetical protein